MRVQGWPLSGFRSWVVGRGPWVARRRSRRDWPTLSGCSRQSRFTRYAFLSCVPVWSGVFLRVTAVMRHRHSDTHPPTLHHSPHGFFSLLPVYSVVALSTRQRHQDPSSTHHTHTQSIDRPWQDKTAYQGRTHYMQSDPAHASTRPPPPPAVAVAMACRSRLHGPQSSRGRPPP